MYRFYNTERSMFGEPFSLCERHFKEQPIPSACTINKIAEKSLQSCVKKED
jgi:hypothetical protein